MWIAPLRIAHVVPPIEAVPPNGYGGTERVVDELVRELRRRGHAVTVFASGDSSIDGPLVPTVPEALRAVGAIDQWAPWSISTLFTVLGRAREFDLIHAHLDAFNVVLARLSPTPVVGTFHGRLDLPWYDRILDDPPPGLVAISASQAASRQNVRWAGVVHNGLTLDAAPFGERPGDALCFVGRFGEEKAAADAIEIARLAGRRIRIAAKPPATRAERAYDREVFRPALRRADAEYLGELSGTERDALFAESWATVMPGAWPEPFGLVAIESLACGTPVVARDAGALGEIVRAGIDGFLADDLEDLAAAVGRVGELDRTRIRREVLDRFSAVRMTDGYETVYAARLGLSVGGAEPAQAAPVASGPAPVASGPAGDRSPGA